MITRLFINYYTSENKERQTELNYCISKNSENVFIDQLNILVEKNDIKSLERVIKLNNEKINIIQIENIPTFKEVVNAIENTTTIDDVNIIVNSDCYLNDTASKFKSIGANELWALSRYNLIDESGKTEPYHGGMTQDAWAFLGKPKKIDNIDFHFGKPGCDNRFAFETHSAGYNVINPCLDVMVIHYHISEKRTYGNGSVREKNRINGGYKKVTPQKLQ